MAAFRKAVVSRCVLGMMQLLDEEKAVVPQVRAILDAAGGREVKVIPCDDAMLYEPLSRAVSLPEPNWEQPRPEGWTRGGAWGSQRTILFSGMKCAPPQARPLFPCSTDHRSTFIIQCYNLNGWKVQAPSVLAHGMSSCRAGTSCCSR